MRIGALIATLGLAVAGIASPAAEAAPPGPSANIQRLVDEKMRLLPGGRQVGPNKIVWDKLGASMEFGTFGPLSCQYEYMCLYGDTDYNDGPDVTPWKLNFWVCTARDLGDWGVRNQTSSVVNNQTAHTWGSLHKYRDESRPGNGYIQIWGAGAYAADNDLSPNNDIIDVVDPC